MNKQYNVDDILLEIKSKKKQGSAGITAPLIKVAYGEAKYKAKSAISFGSPILNPRTPSLTLPQPSVFKFGMVISVATPPGQMTLQRMPFGAYI